MLYIYNNKKKKKKKKNPQKTLGVSCFNTTTVTSLEINLNFYSVRLVIMLEIQKGRLKERKLLFCPFSFGHCVVCPSIYRFRLLL